MAGLQSRSDADSSRGGERNRCEHCNESLHEGQNVRNQKIATSLELTSPLSQAHGQNNVNRGLCIPTLKNNPIVRSESGGDRLSGSIDYRHSDKPRPRFRPSPALSPRRGV